MKSPNKTEVCSVRLTDLLCAEQFEEWHKTEDDQLYGLRLPNGGTLTVLDRMTGWGDGIRDIESGYKDKDDKFWLASGNFDIRQCGEITIAQAIDLVKRNANTCIGA